MEKRHKFYYTKAWRATARAYKEEQYYRCENCGNMFINNDCGMTVAQQLQVHHKIAITDEMVERDDELLYDFDNLELLCVKCHNSERRGSVCADGYKMIDGRLVKI